jgi:hypothetical protein
MKELCVLTFIFSFIIISCYYYYYLGQSCKIDYQYVGGGRGRTGIPYPFTWPNIWIRIWYWHLQLIMIHASWLWSYINAVLRLRAPVWNSVNHWYRLVRSGQPYRRPGAVSFPSGTGGELSTASVAPPPPTYCILLRSSSVGKLAVFFDNVFRMALVRLLCGGGR